MFTKRGFFVVLTTLAVATSTVVAGPGHAAGPGDDIVRLVGQAPLAVPGTGEGVPADLTNVQDGSGVATHPWTGEVYYVEKDLHRVRRIDRDNRVWTVAGDGTAGFFGDGGPSVEARLNSPEGIAFDGAGNLYIADTVNDRVRRIDTLGFISTVAGGGTASSSFALNDVGDGAPASDAILSLPTDVAVTEDGTALYIADSDNHRIRRVANPVGTQPFIWSAAGGDAGFSGDGDFAADAQLNRPGGVAVSPDGSNVLIADTFNRRVRQIYPSGVILTIAGDGAPGRPAEAGLGTEESIGAVTDVTFDHGLVPYFSSVDSNEVFRIEDARTFRVSGLGGGTFGTADNQTYVDPDALAFDAAGNLLVAHEFEVMIIQDPDATSLTLASRSNVFGRPAEDEIKRLYQAAFGRTPDPAGHRFWLDEYQGADGTPTALLDIARSFLASGESAMVYGDDPDDEEFVDVLYLNVLGRPGEASGRAFWLSQLAVGVERAEVLVSFANSPENVAGTRTAIALTPVQMQIMRLYRPVFLRPPDAAGLFFWTEQAASGMDLETMAGEFLASPEGADLRASSGDNAVYVEHLYSNVLGRLPDDAGLNFWIARLESGEFTPAGLLVEFSESLENKQATGTA